MTMPEGDKEGKGRSEEKIKDEGNTEGTVLQTM